MRRTFRGLRDGSRSSAGIHMLMDHARVTETLAPAQGAIAERIAPNVADCSMARNTAPIAPHTCGLRAERLSQLRERGQRDKAFY